MRAVRHTFCTVFSFARYIHIAPTCTRRQNHRFAFQRCAVFQLYTDQTITARRDQLIGFLHIHHVHRIGFDMLFQCGCQLRPFGFGHRDEVFNRQGIQHLTTETLSDHTCGNAFARRVNGRRRTGRTAADHEYIKCCFRIQFLRSLGISIAIELR